MLATSYKEHLHVVIGNLNEDPRGFYRFIRLKRADSTGILLLKVDDNTLTTDTDKAECLSSHFSSVFTDENRVRTIPKKAPNIQYPIILASSDTNTQYPIPIPILV